MTKKHFIKLAEYLRDHLGYCEPFTDSQIEHLANFCHSVNPNFKTDRFLGYVRGKNGPSGGRIKKFKVLKQWSPIPKCVHGNPKGLCNQPCGEVTVYFGPDRDAC